MIPALPDTCSITVITPSRAGVTPPTMSKIEARLKEREEARKAAVAARRLEKEREGRPEETAKYFGQQFTSKKAGTF